MAFPLCALRSPHDPRDHIAEGVFQAMAPGAPRLAGLPPTLDLRPMLPPVRDQGATSTCAAHTAACMKEWQERVDTGFVGHMSPEFVYGFRANAPDAGMTGRDTMDILHKKGICSEEMFWETEPADPVRLAAARGYQIAEYAQVLTIAGLKEALCRAGPCYAAFPLFHYGAQFFKPEGDQPMQGGHAVCVVGYDAAGFILRNSWGTAWADQGYARYSFADFGAHWEIWTGLDRAGSRPMPPLPPRAASEKWVRAVKACIGC